MTIRGWVWLTGLLLVGLVASLVTWHEGVRRLAPILLLIALCTIGLGAELSMLAASKRSSEPLSRVPTGARPADGRVELAPITGCITKTNSRDVRLKRFFALDQSEASIQRAQKAPATALLGRVAILSLFLGKDGKGWTEAEIAQAYKSILRAAEWIEKEALRWKAPVNLVVADTYFAVDDGARDEVEIAFQAEGEYDGPLEKGAVTKALIAFTRAAARLGFADSSDMVGRIDGRIEADAWVWLLHPRYEGRSLAVPEADTALPGVTLAVCYAREASFPQPLTEPPYPDPVTFVHELLHLFGASDKYDVPFRDFTRGEVTEHDVMYLAHEQLSRLRIDPLTASEIGWRDFAK